MIALFSVRVVVPTLLVLLAAVGLLALRGRESTFVDRLATAPVAKRVLLVAFWGLICPMLLLDNTVSEPLRILLASCVAAMWLRGAGWLVVHGLQRAVHPLFGIVHHAAIIAMALVQLVAFRIQLDRVMGSDLMVLALMGVVLVTLAASLVQVCLDYVRSRRPDDSGSWQGLTTEAVEDRLATLPRATIRTQSFCEV